MEGEESGFFEGGFPRCALEERLRALVAADDAAGLDLALQEEVGFPVLCWAVCAGARRCVAALVARHPYQLEVAEDDGRSPAECAAASLRMLHELRCWRLAEAERLAVLQAAPLWVIARLVEFRQFERLVPRMDLGRYYLQHREPLAEFLLFFDRWVDVTGRRVRWPGGRSVLDEALHRRDAPALRFVVARRRLRWPRLLEKYGVEKLREVLHSLPG